MILCEACKWDTDDGQETHAADCPVVAESFDRVMAAKKDMDIVVDSAARRLAAGVEPATVLRYLSIDAYKLGVAAVLKQVEARIADAQKLRLDEAMRVREIARQEGAAAVTAALQGVDGYLSAVWAIGGCDDEPCLFRWNARGAIDVCSCLKKTPLLIALVRLAQVLRGWS